MRYEKIDTRLFIENRHRFVQQLKPNSIAVFHSNDIMPKNADGTFKFIQHTDLFYLSGIDQEETILVIFPDSKEEEHREILFLRETNEEIAIWEGKKLTKEEATEISGIKTIYWTHQFPKIFNELMAEAEHVYLNTNEHLRAVVEVETRDMRFIRWCKERYPLHTYERAQPIMHRLRAVKSDIEIALLQKACDIVEKGFRRVLSFIRPGVYEYEIEAELYHEFIRNRSRWMAFEPIIASGANACILHYEGGASQCKDGDLILLDFGAEYANYNADLSRTIPVNGKFTKRQKEVYNAVLRVQKQATQLLRVGNTLKQYHEEVGKIMEQELIGLGLLDAEEVKKQDPKKPLYKKYFMHGTSHHLGLNVHDYGNKHMPFQAGMVFTCEPGIYIPAEGIGVRIENDILITNGEPYDLMRNIPREVEEIEELMNGRK